MSDGGKPSVNGEVQPFRVGRIGELREFTRKRFVETRLGPIEAELLRVVCNGCGHVQELNMDRFGLDWPDVLEHWATVEGRGDLCPTCMRDLHGGDDGRE